MNHALEAVRTIIQTAQPQSLQDILWNAAGPWWWTGYALVCAIGSFFLFINLLHEAEFNALSIGRMIWMAGLVCGAFVRFNSACEFMSAALMATGGTFMAFLLTTQWCHREGSPRQKVAAILREMIWRTESTRKLR